MGKLTSPRSPPSQAASPAIPRMDPPPPYDAPSSRSSSAHSHDRLQGGRSGGDQEAQAETQPQPQVPQQEADRGQNKPHPTTEKKDEGGCLTFGEGASGCMVYGDHAEGKKYESLKGLGVVG